MLNTLRRIIQAVNDARDLDQALGIIVHQVRHAMQADVCSVYLTDYNAKEHVLMATDGLNPNSVGHVRLEFGKGLVSIVANRAEPVNLNNAPSHPAYEYFPETAEEQFFGFLGVPILHKRIVLGVLIVQQIKAEKFDEEHENFLITIAAQLASAMAHAEATGEIEKLISQHEVTDARPLHGLPGAYLLMLDSHSLRGVTAKRIMEGNWAPGALRSTIDEQIQTFAEMDDPYMRERAEDLRELARRILHYLVQDAQREIEYPEATILVGDELTAAQMAEVPRERLAAVISATGSRTSHVAILARALDIPAVMGSVSIPLGRVDGKTIIADGYSGNVYISPPKQVRDEYQRLAREEQILVAELLNLRDDKSVTSDGKVIPLNVNTGLLSDITPSLNSGADGIGLYRTEFPFMTRQRFPGEEEQMRIYRQALLAFSPRSVTLRTLDVGGDKSLPYFPIKEDNPFLGWRGIRITLDHPEIFLVQVRAMIRAAVDLNNLQILLPMISQLGEIHESLALIKRAFNELIEEGYEVRMPKVGVMIEVPSAVYQAERIARLVDFVSIGTNDLTQYLLAVDRNNAQVASLYDALHPAVIQAVQQTVLAAHAAGKPASVCGEMAGDPAAVVLLVGMGVDSLSMSASSLNRVKWVIRNLSTERARQYLDDALDMDDAVSIRSFLNTKLENAGMGGLVRAGR